MRAVASRPQQATESSAVFADLGAEVASLTGWALIDLEVDGKPLGKRRWGRLTAEPVGALAARRPAELGIAAPGGEGLTADQAGPWNPNAIPNGRVLGGHEETALRRVSTRARWARMR